MALGNLGATGKTIMSLELQVQRGRLIFRFNLDLSGEM